MGNGDAVSVREKKSNKTKGKCRHELKYGRGISEGRYTVSYMESFLLSITRVWKNTLPCEPDKIPYYADSGKTPPHGHDEKPPYYRDMMKNHPTTGT